MATTNSVNGERQSAAEQSLGDLVATATKDMSLLIHKEVELAKSELSRTASTAGIGAGLLGAAGFAGFLAILLASFAGAFGFSDGFNIPLWAGFLCMTGVYLVIGAIIGAIGVRRVKSLKGPERTQRTLKDSLAWAKHPRRA